jgi:hypothetical protein
MKTPNLNIKNNLNLNYIAILSTIQSISLTSPIVQIYSVGILKSIDYTR